ncbi:MAG: aldehyde dehydrogenase family protein [Deltaproteobacteria bacterium]|nr:aldehyde dehydrogenase family protein [Deltaproteobacteria bacterium]
MELIPRLKPALAAFCRRGGMGPDPLAAQWRERRAEWSLFARCLSEAEIEALRPYIFAYERLPDAPGDEPIPVYNFIAGEWRKAAEAVDMPALFDRRVRLSRLPRSQAAEVEGALAAGYSYWQSLAWAEETLQYRKWVVKNFSRILHYYEEACLREIRQQIPKTRLEAQKDFWEAKRAADHLEGAADKAMLAELLPPMVDGHTYWKNSFLPAGLCVLLTPMNFIYGIPVIQILGCYLAGSPFVFKGHPFAGITNTSLIRMLLAAGAAPGAVQKIEGFGKDIAALPIDPRVAVASVTGSEETAKSIQRGRGIRPLRFEGGGCNWAWIDDGFGDTELQRIAERLTYSKLALSSHKCTGLHGVAGSEAVVRQLEPLFDAEFGKWTIEDPRRTASTTVIGPCMVHRAGNGEQIVAAAQRAGCRIVRAGGTLADTDYARNAEVLSPAIIGGITPGLQLTINWDGRGPRTFVLATTELFLPVLVTMVADFESFLRFSLWQNPHDLATVFYTRDDRKLQRARRVVAGMHKENDGTDSALEWEAFGASGVGESGNSSVGDAASTIRMFCREQKGRHVLL